ncbi:thrombospondin type 3 repeat-containing protein, partial [Candidatus Woesearchaeota archaeon]|nr:thrombospondin type 3 repeat-containing protein [Candidatus Woesearchaeota archaeon]
DSSGKLVYGWTTATESKLTVRDLKLKDGEKYHIEAYAQNRAGMKTDVARSDGVIVNVLLNLESACSDKVRNGDEADVDCGGSCSAKCANGKSCIIQSDCKSAYCVDGVCKAGSCTDSIRNQDETGIDCGGSCTSKCDMGQGCKKAADCETGICTEGFCVAEGPCSNKRLDPGETDVDCGGVCVPVKNNKCLANQKCSGNSDCKTGLCGLAGKCANLNDRDSDGILNDADLCPEVPNTSPGKRQTDSDGDRTGDECDNDNDNDGMPDDWEKKYGLNSLDGSDALSDLDGDGVSNLDEFNLGISPKSADTDKDGADDGREVELGTDPKNPKSKPKGNFAMKATIFLVLMAFGFGAASIFASRRNKGSGKGGQSMAYKPHPPTQAPASHHAPQQQPVRHSQPQPEYRQHHYSSRHEVFDELHKTYSKMSGEELFEHLRRKTGKR